MQKMRKVSKMEVPAWFGSPVSLVIVLDFHLFSGGRSVKMLLITIHKWSGYGMAVLAALHFAWHWNWLRHAARTLWKR